MDTQLDSSEPIYIQISNRLRQLIHTELEAGEYLPPEVQLAETFSVNRHTIRAAIDELVQDGLLERYRGRGTVVLNVPIQYPLTKNSRHTNTLTAKGFKTTREIIWQKMVFASEGVAQRLEIEPNSEIWWLESVRIVNGRRLMVSSQFVPQPWASEIHKHFQGGSVLEFLGDHCGLSLSRKYTLITAILPEDDDAHYLNVSRRLPFLRTKTAQVDVNSGRVAEYSVTRSRSDAIELRVETP